MADDTNLNVSSNLMLDDFDHKPEHKYFPGDFLALVNKTLIDSRIIDSNLTDRQIVEYKQYLTCLFCGRTCAGTCTKTKKVP
jgi:hypothetical protein